MARVIVAGALANKIGNGGGAWERMSWLRGLLALGHDCTFVEQIDSAQCVDAAGAPATLEGSANLAWFRAVTQWFGVAGRAALVSEGGDAARPCAFGLDWAEVVRRTRGADLLVNLSGHLDLEPLASGVRRRAYLDLDPGFTQVWHAQGLDGARLDGHDLFFTLAENLGSAECGIPGGGLDWQPARQPVTLGDWPVILAADPRRFTTVASWRGAYGPVEHDGRRFGLKAHAMRRFMDLPARMPLTLEIALDIDPADDRDRVALRTHGWSLVDPRAVAGDPESFRQYIQGSGGEWSVAQGIYVETASGWFSDRSTRYLASGKPVLVEDTGFGRSIPTGEGVLVFRTPDEAVAGAEAILADYPRHARAARAIAAEYFAAEHVLRDFLERAGLDDARRVAVTRGARSGVAR